jgi:signal transduction histidine kinase
VVNDVLDFARPIRFDYSPADVNAVCADAEQATRQGPESATVKFTPSAGLKPIVTDAERLRMALVNILDNARHAVADKKGATEKRGREPFSDDELEKGSRPLFSPSGPDIEMETMNGSTGHVSIVIRDRGIGVKPEDMPRVFDPYFTTKRTGSGLGLAIAKNIIEGMGGAIALESRYGVGTEIRIDLPSKAPSAAARA